MARPKIKLRSSGVVSLLHDPGVVADLERRMAPAASAARSSAPRSDNDGPHYADNLVVRSVRRRDRTVVQLASTVSHGLKVEAAHGTLARAFGSVR